MTPLDEAQIYDLLRTALIELFEIEPERISMDANLYEDLEIDSIDAIDLIDHVKRKTGYRLVAEDFRSVRTIGDVVAALLRKQQQGNCCDVLCVLPSGYLRSPTLGCGTTAAARGRWPLSWPPLGCSGRLSPIAPLCALAP